MPNNVPFQRRIINPLQRPTAEDHNLQASYSATTDSAILRWTMSNGTSFDAGFIGDSFRTQEQSPSRGVRVRGGLAVLLGAGATDIGGIPGVLAGLTQTLSMVSNVDLSIDSLASGKARIDSICVRLPTVLGSSPTALVEQQSIGILNPTANTFTLQPRPTEYTADPGLVIGDNNLVVVKGTEVLSPSSPSAPSVPSGYVEIARVFVPTGSGALAITDIEDHRNLVFNNNSAIRRYQYALSVTSAIQSVEYGIWSFIVPSDETINGYTVKAWNMYFSVGNQAAVSTTPTSQLIFDGSPPLEEVRAGQAIASPQPTVDRATVESIVQSFSQTPIRALGENLIHYKVYVGALTNPISTATTNIDIRKTSLVQLTDYALTMAVTFSR